MMTRPQDAVETRSSTNVCENDDVTMPSAEAVTLKPMDCSSGGKENFAHKQAASLPVSTASMSSSTAASTSVPTVAQNGESGIIHFCFIVHGHQGKPTDLSYLHHAIKDRANQHGAFDTTKSSEMCSVGRNNSSSHQIIIGGSKSSTFIVHNAACNEGTTHDGVVKGGERLANEILEVIRGEIEQSTQHHTQDVTISIVGNSLGGLYGRYAVAILDELLFASDEDGTKDMPHYILDDNIRLHFNVFCSTASPHLGCADRTYVPIPRFAEVGIAKRMGETGLDLFRVNDLMLELATSPKFTRPLALFRKRIAYANAYGTDFVVPGSTAAFLDGASDSLHYFDAISEEETQSKRHAADRICPATEEGLFVATCYTPRLSTKDPFETSGNDLEVMSKNLDSLGWTKVFVDMRDQIPVSTQLPLMSNTCPIKTLSSNRKAVTSKDLCEAISSGGGGRISLPFGHNSICAFERGSFSTAFNKGGRPVMDSLAINLIEDISMWTLNA